MPSKRLACLILLVTPVVLSSALTLAADPPATPRSSRDAVTTLRLADPALTIELVAAEPDIISPVAVAWDEDGRMYVTEMNDNTVSGSTAGRIKQLEDRDAETGGSSGSPYSPRDSRIQPASSPGTAACS